MDAIIFSYFFQQLFYVFGTRFFQFRTFPYLSAELADLNKEEWKRDPLENLTSSAIE